LREKERVLEQNFILLFSRTPIHQLMTRDSGKKNKCLYSVRSKLHYYQMGDKGEPLWGKEDGLITSSVKELARKGAGGNKRRKRKEETPPVELLTADSG